MRGYRAEDFADCGADGFWCSGGGFSEPMLELGEDLFDRVQVGRIFRQEEEFGAGRSDELAHGLALVTAEIVDDDDVALPQRGDKDPLDIGSKALAVDWPLDQPWRIDPVEAERGQEGRRFPTAVRDFGYQSLTTRCPSTQRRHIGLGPSLVNEDQALRFDAILILGPLRAPPRHGRTIALASHHAFF